MDTDLAQEVDLDLDVQSILLAASEHDIPTLRKLLRGPTPNAANVKDGDTGATPLHTAIAACKDDSTQSDGQAQTNGHTVNGSSSSNLNAPQTPEELGALETVKFLLQNGAIWNDLDNNNETPGCIAKRLGLKGVYDVMVDAGTRAEMLLSRLDEYEQLQDEDSEEDGNEEVENGERASSQDLISSIVAPPPSAAEPSSALETVDAPGADINSEDYLHSALTFTNNRLLDADKNGVMMSWESDIMRKSVDAIVPSNGLKVLNIGFGMGIIDSFFQAKSPAQHHIIEAHSAVLEKMKADGWPDKPGVTIHEGKWQDIVPKLLAEAQMFDAIYFDTFAEDYKALRKFFDESVIGLLEDGGKWSFFNGLGADRQICYDVYAKVVEMDLLESGYDVDWDKMNVPDLEEERTWEGVKRPYWKLDEYRLPVITFLN